MKDSWIFDNLSFHHKSFNFIFNEILFGDMNNILLWLKQTHTYTVYHMNIIEHISAQSSLMLKWIVVNRNKNKVHS